MALPVKHFKGEIEGKTIYTYKNQLDYNIKTLEERINKAREILNIEIIEGIEFSKDEFWNVIFDQTFDERLNKEGVYYVEELESFLNYKEFIKFCNDNEIDPIDYLDITNPFADISYDDNEEDDIESGVWEYSCLNTSKIKLVLTTQDGLYSDTNVCKVLSKMCEYILEKTPRGKSTRYFFYTHDQLKKAEKDDAKINEKFKIAEEKDMMLFLKDASINYKFEKKQVVDIEDGEDMNLPYLKDYMNILKEGKTILSLLRRCDRFFEKANSLKRDGKDYGLTDLMMRYGLQEADFEIYNTWHKKRRGLISLCKSIPSDAILTKDCVRGTIYFKSPLRDEGYPDWDMVDMMDKNHVKALIGVKRGNDLQDDLTCIVTDLKDLIEQTSLTERQLEILELWKEDKSQTEIGEILGLTQQAINSSMDKIANNIAKKYEEQYEEWYYLNIRKGQYKTCSKCGEVKLLQRFDKKGKQGYQSQCKECRKL